MRAREFVDERNKNVHQQYGKRNALGIIAEKTYDGRDNAASYAEYEFADPRKRRCGIIGGHEKRTDKQAAGQDGVQGEDGAAFDDQCEDKDRADEGERRFRRNDAAAEQVNKADKKRNATGLTERAAPVSEKHVGDRGESLHVVFGKKGERRRRCYAVHGRSHEPRRRSHAGFGKTGEKYDAGSGGRVGKILTDTAEQHFHERNGDDVAEDHLPDRHGVRQVQREYQAGDGGRQIGHR